MSLVQKVRSVEREFRLLDTDLAQFRATSGLGCPSSCGKCCHSPTISATPLEFLPYAHAAFMAGKAEAEWERLEKAPPKLCALLKPFLPDGQRGYCSDYLYRGLTCRLFGFSAMRNKHGQATLYTCKIIKTEQADRYQAAEAAIRENTPVPIVSDWYRRLENIDAELGGQTYPINEAIRRALEVVLQYYAYRQPPKASSKAL